MKAYSLDLRERVIRSIRNGRQQTWVARELGISIGTVKRYIKLEHATGSLAPKRQQREQPKIQDADLAALQAQVDVHLDATLDEHIAYWQASHGVQVGRATMCRALQRADRPLKKNDTGARTR